MGPERAALGWASHSLAGAGARLAFGSDWPNLPLDPVAGLNAAVNRSIARRTQESETIEEERPPDAVLYANEALALKSAINAWTSNAAWASFDEHRKGMIKAGMLADLVVLSADILTGTPEKLASTEVDVTIFDGKVVTSGIDATRPTSRRSFPFHHQSHVPKGRDVGRRIPSTTTRSASSPALT